MYNINRLVYDIRYYMNPGATFSEFLEVNKQLNLLILNDSLHVLPRRAQGSLTG